MTTVTLEWRPRALEAVFAQTQEAIDSLELSHLVRTVMGRTVKIELDVEGDEHAVHSAVDEARTKLKRFAVNGVVRWLKPKE